MAAVSTRFRTNRSSPQQKTKSGKSPLFDKPSCHTQNRGCRRLLGSCICLKQLCPMRIPFSTYRAARKQVQGEEHLKHDVSLIKWVLRLEVFLGHYGVLPSVLAFRPTRPESMDSVSLESPDDATRFDKISGTLVLAREMVFYCF